MRVVSEYLAQVRDSYDELVNHTDPRIKDYVFVGNPLPPALVILAYFAFLIVGPKWMKNREPFQMKNLLIAYNFTIVIFTAYILKEFLLNGWLFDYSVFGCEPVDYSNAPKAVRIANAAYYFYIAKFIELLDTVFFILRKKNSQVTFLHVFHHGGLPMLWWWGLKRFPGGSATFHCTVNCFVHVVMYSYYGLAGFGPKMQKYLWWKKYVTVIQLTQFLLVTLHNAWVMIIGCSAFPAKDILIMQTFCFILAGLFLNFYIKTYLTAKSKAKLGTAANGLSDKQSEGTVVIRNGANDCITNTSVTRRNVPTKL